jgi:hypothetical protein
MDSANLLSFENSPAMPRHLETLHSGGIRTRHFLFSADAITYNYVCHATWAIRRRFSHENATSDNNAYIPTIITALGLFTQTVIFESRRVASLR